MTVVAKPENQLVESYPLDHVRERLISKHLLAEEIVDEAIAEYKRYMTLISLGYGPLDMFSRQVDEVWHAHILFTQDYANFCQQVFGRYLHHNPKTARKSMGKKQQGANRFIEAYKEVFRTQPPAIWSGLNSTSSDCGSDCCGG